ncbi:MAG: hypothetical protein QF535_05965 [Anaerolineales bacterium]|jgi:hypothetical protein|nr:hypothetical protein [Anaerolineales bacterium]
MVKSNNNVLAIILIVAIVISIGGTAMSAVKLSGRATSGTGTTSVTISELIAITVSGNIAFGSGYVNESGANATLTSNGTATQWSNGTAPTSDIVITNTGNADAQINVNASSNATSWIGATATAAFAGEVNEVGACGGTLNVTWATLQDNTQKLLCDVLQWENANDAINLNIKLTIPEALVGGGAEDSVTVKVWAAAD